MRTGAKQSLTSDRRVVFVLIALFCVTLFTGFKRVVEDGRFVAVAYFDGAIKVRLITGRVWSVPIHEGCDLVITASMDANAMPSLRTLPDDSGLHSIESCNSFYAPPPEKRSSSGTVGP